MTDYPVALVNPSFYTGSGGGAGVSTPSGGFPAAGSWEWSRIAGFTFELDRAAAETVYNTPGIIGWRLDIHVASVAGATTPGSHKLYWNFAFDNPGVADTGSPGHYTAYGPEDDSPGSYFDITGPGDYSIPVGPPYFNTYADTPYEVLDRMRNNVTDGLGRHSGDAGFTGLYNHGYGRFEGAFANDTGHVVIDHIAVVFFTEDPVAPVDLPCDTWEDADLGDAVELHFLADPTVYGQYADGVLFAAFPGAAPDFYIPGWIVDPAKSYEVEVTFDPDSSHDGASHHRGVWVQGLDPAHPIASFDNYWNGSGGSFFGGWHSPDYFSGPDTVIFTIGPGIGTWDDATYGAAAMPLVYLETDSEGAVSAIRIRKICGGVEPEGPVAPTDGGGEFGTGALPPPTGPDPTAPAPAGDAPTVAPTFTTGLLTPGNRRSAPTGVEVIVDGHWLALNCQRGEPTWSHTWPGGSANASWSVSGIPSRLTRLRLLVELAYAGQIFWSGLLSEPDSADGQMNAVGLFSVGGDYAALDSDGNATTVPDDAIDAAIARGLPWTRRHSISNDAQDVDVSAGPVKLGELLDAYATDAGQRWAVDPQGHVYASADPTEPTFHFLAALDAPITPATDDMATALIGRYRDSSGYATTPPVLDDSVDWLGYVEDTVDLTSRGVITETKAVAKLHQVLALGRAVPAWADPIVMSYGDLLTPGQVPAALELAAAGQVLRVHGQLDDTHQQGGRPTIDVLAGTTEYSEGQLTWTPFRAPARSIPDLFADLANRVHNRTGGNRA